MIKRSFFLFLTTALVISSDVAIASSGFNTHTQHTPIELKPAFLNPQGSFQAASVCFLGSNCTSGGFNTGDDEYGIDSAQQCKNEGYSKNNCSSVQEAEDVCPYDSNYSKGCKCKSSLVSCSSGQIGEGSSCGGKYLSCSCSSEYQYTLSNCASPRSVSGNSCGGKYEKCICPTGVSAGSFGCEEYYPSPCGSVCKIAKGDNCASRTSVATPYGCMTYFEDCSTKCERAYPDNCRNRSDIYAPYGCQQVWADCSSKCQIPYKDNCLNRTAVNASRGCVKYFSDCSSKCEIAYGPACKIGDIYYSDRTCLVPDYHHLAGSKKALGIVVYITDGGNHGQVMAPRTINENGIEDFDGMTHLEWGNAGIDISALPNYTTNASAATDLASCSNTDKIAAQGDASVYPAAWAAKRYAPTPETKGKWCLPAAGLMNVIRSNKIITTSMVTKLNGSAPCCFIWSSTEYSADKSWILSDSSNNGVYNNHKIHSTQFVQPVLEF